MSTTTASYKKYIEVVNDSGVLYTENLSGDARVTITNITNALKTPGSSDQLLLSLTAYANQNVAFKKVKTATGTTESVGSLQAAGIVYATQPATAYPILSQMAISVTNQGLTVTLPAGSATLPVGSFVYLTNFNDAGKSLRMFEGELLGVLKKSSATDYFLGTIVPTGVTTTTGAKADVVIVGQTRISQPASAFLVKSRTGSLVTITASFSEEYLSQSPLGTDLARFVCVMSGTNPYLRDGGLTERYVFDIKNISNDGSGTITIEDQNGYINEGLVTSASTQARLCIEGHSERVYSFLGETRRIIFTGLTSGDAYIVESTQ